MDCCDVWVVSCVLSSVVSCELPGAVDSLSVSDTALLELLMTTGGGSSGAVVCEVGETRTVLEMMMVVTEPPLLAPSELVEVDKSPSSLDSRSLTVALKLVMKFLDSDRLSKGVLSGGGNVSRLVSVVLVN